MERAWNPHEVLGVPLGAPAEVVRAAYKRAALESHPDKGGSKEAFQRVALAFEVLSGLGNTDTFESADERQRSAMSKKRKAENMQQRTDPKKSRGQQDPPRPKQDTSRGRARSKKKKAESKQWSERNFPEELRKLLQRLDVVNRRRVLAEKLAPWQRCALERWMLESQHTRRCEMKSLLEPPPEVSVQPESELIGAEPVGAAAKVTPGQGHASEPKVADLPKSHGPRRERNSRIAGVTTDAKKRGTKTSTYHRASIFIRHAEIMAKYRKELADAIADQVFLVAIKQRAWSIASGDLFRERLPKAILDVSNEHSYDHGQLRVHFKFSVRGRRLTTPDASWEVALKFGAELIEALPPQGRIQQWLHCGVSVETEEAAWQVFRQKYLDMCEHKPSVERQLARIEAGFAARRASTVEAWQRRQLRLEARQARREKMRLSRLQLCIIGNRKKPRKRRTWMEARVSRVTRVIRIWQLFHDRQTCNKEREESRTAKRAARAEKMAARELRKEAAQKAREHRVQQAMKLKKSAEFSRRLRAERGMTMEEILSVQKEI